MSSPLHLAFPPRQITPSQAVDLAVTAERRGWAGVWLSEVLDIDALALAAALAVRTDRIGIGTAVVPISTRSAATLAMAASTVARLAPGRFALGLGVSTPALVADCHDRPVNRPVVESRGTIGVVRSALAGHRVDHDADPAIRGLRIVPPETPPPILLAALGPAMTELAMSAADGLVLNLIPPESAAARAETARQRRGDGYESLMIVRTIVDPSPDELRKLRREIASYLRVPAYRAAIETCGLSTTFVRSAADLDDMAAGLPEDMLDALSCIGSADACTSRLDQLSAAGVTPLVVPAGGPAAVERTVTALSGAVEGGADAHR